MASLDYSELPIQEKPLHTPPLNEVVDGEFYFLTFDFSRAIKSSGRDT